MNEQILLDYVEQNGWPEFYIRHGKGDNDVRAPYIFAYGETVCDFYNRKTSGDKYNYIVDIYPFPNADIYALEIKERWNMLRKVKTGSIRYKLIKWLASW